MEGVEKDWWDILKRQFKHPAIVFWRAVELRHVDGALGKHKLDAPILDLGCAEGKIAEVLFRDKELIGLDNSWELLSSNRKTDIYKALVLADACYLPYKNGVFGSIFSNCVIEHIADLDSVLDEVARVLKDRGIFLFTVPTHKFGDFLFFSVLFKNLRLSGLSRWYKNKRNKLLNHFHCYDHNRWNEILSHRGLSLVEYDYYMPKEATFLWDFLAAVVLVLKYVWPLNYLLPKMNGWLKDYLETYCNRDSKIGGGLLLIAQKGA